MDLSTQYLGLTLPHPLVAGASPLADDVDSVKRLEDGGAAASAAPSAVTAGGSPLMPASCW